MVSYSVVWAEYYYGNGQSNIEVRMVEQGCELMLQRSALLFELIAKRLDLLAGMLLILT